MKRVLVQRLLTAILILFMLLAPASGGQVVHTVQAATLCYVDDTAAGANNGTSWADAYTNLQSALLNSSCTEIHVAAGIYLPDPTPAANRNAAFHLKSGVAIYGGYPDGGGDTADPSAYETILSGDIGTLGSYSDNSFHIVYGDIGASNTIMDGFTIRDGYANMIGNDRGAGIFLDVSSRPTLKNLVIADNEATVGGGGMYLSIYSSSDLTNVVFHGNAAPVDGSKGGGIWLDYNSTATLNHVTIDSSYAAGNGGGIYDGGRSLVPAIMTDLYLTDVTFTNNHANNSGGGLYIADGNASLSGVTFQGSSSNGDGGGIYMDGVNLTLLDSLFTGNTATSDGGGIYLVSGTQLDLKNTQIVNGTSYGGSGGGLFTEAGSDISIRNASVENNTAGTQGGGMYIGGTILFLGGIVKGNTANGSGGGGIYLNGSPSANLTNIVIDSNSAGAGGWGGGIYSTSSSANLTNLRISNNTAHQGGGMMLSNSTIEIVNSTIYGNDANAAIPAYAFFSDHALSAKNLIVWGHPGTASSIVLTYNATFDSSLLEDDCPVNGTCPNLVNGDPQFVDAANGDFRLKPLSVAVDKGDLSALPVDIYDLDGDGNVTEQIPFDIDGEPRVAVMRVDLGAYETQTWNINWTQALNIPLFLHTGDEYYNEVFSYLDQPGQSRWFRFLVNPDSQVIVTLTDLPANYDLTLYKDIGEAYNEMNDSGDLVQLSAEFAPDTFSPDTFSPDTFSPDTFSPDTFSPDTFSPDTFSPDTFSPDTFSPDTFSPDTFSPDTFSPDTFSPDTFSPDTFSPDTFSPDTFSPDTFSPDTFSPDTFSSAQTRSLIAVSAHEGTLGEGIRVNTWTKSGYFYVRVKGRYGAFDQNAPFHLEVMMLSGTCKNVSPLLPPSSVIPSLVDGTNQTLILTNSAKIQGSDSDKALLTSKLNALAAATGGSVIDVSSDNRVVAASQQVEENKACVYAMNVMAGATKDIVDAFRAHNPGLEYIVLVGSDQAIPFFRYADNALLASETEFSPPVLDNSISQASLKSGYILSQDAYGASIEVSNKSQTLPIPDLAVGRLVETASEISTMITAFLDSGGMITPSTALVTGYDFLADVAGAVQGELENRLTISTLIQPRDQSPEASTAWTADNLRSSLLGSSHDLVFLAGHFSASSALAADYKTRMKANELLASSTSFSNTLVYSAGCHSGYNVVDSDSVPNVTEQPDWSQAFAAKGATFIGGTGYQYGDTDFIEYSERLYLEFTKQLSYGTDPVAIGKALAQAKQVYLANTPLMRGIHEKSVLEATLFGLPMMKIDMPGRVEAPIDQSEVDPGFLFDFGTNPGSSLGLQYYDLNLSEATTENTKTLDQAPQDASYLVGPDGVVVNPAEPVMPLDLVNVTHPTLPDMVLRGVGWRGGAYTDLLNRLPLTGAATEDLRAPHPAFFSDVFYPIRPWNINYYDALSGGQTRLAVMPGQYRSLSPGSITGTLRQWTEMDFRLYYSGNVETYTSSAVETWTNTPALAAPPDVTGINSTVNNDGSITFQAMVTGDPAAGIQEVWIVYQDESLGEWLPFDLSQDSADSRLWTGTLNGPAGLSYVVQAVNGVGLVTMMTNNGAYYQAGVDPAVPTEGQDQASLTFENPPTSGQYGGTASFTAVLSGPPAGSTVLVSLGGQGKYVQTDSSGRATAEFALLSQPQSYTLNASFAGDPTYAPVSTEGSFTIEKGTSQVVLQQDLLYTTFGLSSEFTATVTSGSLPLARKPVAITVDFGGVRQYTGITETDYAGVARWEVPALPLGTYAVKAWFGEKLSDDLDLTNLYYEGSTDTATLQVGPYPFTGFFSPVDNTPTINRVKAGSAVPVKFSIGGDFGLNIFASGYPTSTTMKCTAGTVDTVEQTVSAGTSSLIYDPLSGQYTYIWKTDKKWAGTCRILTLRFIEGTEKSVYFNFTK